MEPAYIEKLKQLAKDVSEIAESVPEKYQLEAFKIILNKLLLPQVVAGQKIHSETSGEVTPSGELGDSQKLADLCQVTSGELKNVISIKGKNIDLVYRLKEDNESFQQIVGSLVILLSYEILFEMEWVKSSTILETLKKIGVHDKGGNFSSYLKNRSDLFLKNGSAQEYRLTTNNGRAMASKIIGKLAKGEQVAKADIKSN